MLIGRSVDVHIRARFLGLASAATGGTLQAETEADLFLARVSNEIGGREYGLNGDALRDGLEKSLWSSSIGWNGVLPPDDRTLSTLNFVATSAFRTFLTFTFGQRRGVFIRTVLPLIIGG
jgi:hypothetical protein